MTKNCEICSKEFNAIPYHLRKGQGRFCSMPCRDVWQKTRIEEKHPNWKGEKVGYHGIHKRMVARYGKANRCEDENCDGVSKRFEWANISGEYKWERNDWKMLCKKCHFKFDFNEEWRLNMSKVKLGKIPWNKNKKYTEEQKSRMNFEGLKLGRLGNNFKIIA